MEQISHKGAKIKYAQFKARISVDDQYVNIISSVPDPHISLLQGATKAAANINTHTGYDLHGSSAQLVQTLLQQKHYIYPWTEHGGGFKHDKPYEHPAIIRTLCNDLFSGHDSILLKYQQHFKPSEEHTYALTQAMVALVAMAVFASLKEWESGPYVPTNFMTNTFGEIYCDHIKDLNDIQDQSKQKYESLMCHLFRLALNLNIGLGNDLINSESIIDINNMAID
ncbi:hypothetical protein APHAL10511_008419 [Amanita phalloides]|nr:hypothetical protein APHAL10511_008419 [Amanita phalloides]